MAKILICDYCKQQVDDVTQITINGDEFDFCQDCAEALIHQLTGCVISEPAIPEPEDPPKTAPKRKGGRPRGSSKKKTTKKVIKKVSTDPVTKNVGDTIDLSGDDATVKRALHRIAQENPNAFNNLVEFTADINDPAVRKKLGKRFKQHRKTLQRQFNKSEGGGGINVNIEKD